MNLQACSTAHFRRLYQVVQMMIKGFQSRFKVCQSIYIHTYIHTDLHTYMYTYIHTDIPSRAITRRIVVFEQIELGLQADEPH